MRKISLIIHTCIENSRQLRVEARYLFGWGLDMRGKYSDISRKPCMKLETVISCNITEHDVKQTQLVIVGWCE